MHSIQRVSFALTALISLFSFSPSEARAEGAYKHAYRLCMADYATKATGDIKFYMRLARKVCAQVAQNPNPNQLADWEARYDQGRNPEAEAAASFLLGVATGFIGSYNPGGGGGSVVRGSAGRSGSRVVTHGTTTVRTVNTVSAPATVRTVPVTSSSSVGTTTNSRSSGAPVGYITQPNGAKDPYYSKQPCAKTAQTGPTSYKCTNN